MDHSLTNREVEENFGEGLTPAEVNQAAQLHPGSAEQQPVGSDSDPESDLD